MRRSTLLWAPLLVLALLAGCDHGGNDLGSGARADSGSGASRTDGASGTGSDDKAEPQERNAGGSCLAGSWEPADMSEYGIDQIESLGGSFDFTMTFDGSTVSVNVASAVPATDYTDELTMVVTVRGSYSVSGDTIKVSNLTGSTTINGEEQAGDSSLGFGDLSAGESTYSCNGSRLTLDGEKFSRK